jgi:hypothetical protein
VNNKAGVVFHNENTCVVLLVVVMISDFDNKLRCRPVYASVKNVCFRLMLVLSGALLIEFMC